MDNILDSILRSDFGAFIHKVFNTINPCSVYEDDWYINLIADVLLNTDHQDHKRVIINLPPRNLKSICVSVAWPAWILGHNPAKRIMVASYSQSLSIKHSLDTRMVMNSEWYLRLFPNTRLSKKHNLKSKFLTTENGFRMATSVGGMSTGDGADFLIIDDPHNPSHIHSSKRRSQVIDWYEQTFSTRLNDKKAGVIILVMQRLHESDLCGYLNKAHGDLWRNIIIPIYTENTITYNIAHKNYIFLQNTYISQERYSDDIVALIEKEMGKYNFAAQYLQKPLNINSGFLKVDDIMWYQDLDIQTENIIQSWDTAIKTSEDSDYSVCTTWAIINNCYYVLDIFRGKMAYPKLKQQIITLQKKYKPRLLLIEDHANGQSLIQDLKNENIYNIVPIKHKLDKVTRFTSILPFFQSKTVYFHDKLPTVILQEIYNFPHTKHDDVIDSISQFLRYIQNVDFKINNFRIR